MSSTAYHGWTHRRKAIGGTDPRPHEGFMNIKVFGDREQDPAVTQEDGAFFFAIQDDLDKLVLRRAEAFISTLGSANLIVQFHNVTAATDMLSTRVRIDSGDYTSYTSAAPSVVDESGTPPHNEISTGDLIRVDIDEDGGGDAKGLGVLLWFGDRRVV